MNLKRFKRGGDGNSDELLKWIEQGCFDALSKKYLKSAVLTVLADSSSPNNVLETYTLRVNYPDSLIHQTIDAATNNIAQLSLTRNDKSVLSVESSPSTFKDSVSKILRSLCVMSQTLKNLPSKKCLSMKLSYYEEVTPLGYEPPGFVAAEFDIDHLFQGPTSKYSFGKAATPYHNLGLSMETMCDDTRSTGKVSSADSQVVRNTIDAQEGMDFNESVMIASQVAQPANSPPKFPQSQQQALPASIVNVASPPSKSSKVPLSELPETQQRIQIIKCTCGVFEKELEMLQCDSCSNWQHTVCAGFVSCRDRRLELSNGYVCYYCRFTGRPNSLNFIQSLSLMRKALAIISAEGFETTQKLSTRLNISIQRARALRIRLTEEHFLLDCGNSKFKIAKKDENIKERIKCYFNQNLEIHEGFIDAQEEDKGSPKKRRGSSDEDTLVDEYDINEESGKKDVPIEIGNTAPFVVTDNDSAFADTRAVTTVPASKVSIIPVTPPTPPTATKPNSISKLISIPPDTPSTINHTNKKKRKISIPSSKISCYFNKNT